MKRTRISPKNFPIFFPQLTRLAYHISDSSINIARQCFLQFSKYHCRLSMPVSPEIVAVYVFGRTFESVAAKFGNQALRFFYWFNPHFRHSKKYSLLNESLIQLLLWFCSWLKVWIQIWYFCIEWKNSPDKAHEITKVISNIFWI